MIKEHLIRESDVLRHVCQYLKQRNYFFTRINNIPAPGRGRSKWQLPGLPDIIVLWKGVMICIEVKRPSLQDREPNGRKVRGGKLSMYQAEFASKVAINDGEFFCVHSVEELDQFLSDMRQARGLESVVPTKEYGKVQ
jgi:hypothetical protein